MKNHPESDHNRASIALYYIVALNTKRKLKNTINRTEVAQVLADLLHIDLSTPASWMRGDFRRHPVSRENFLKFVRTYRTKPGLESTKEILALAIDLYGRDYKNAIQLLDPADRESDPEMGILVRLRGTSDVVITINELLEFDSPENIRIAFATLTAYQWLAMKSSFKNILM